MGKMGDDFMDWLEGLRAAGMRIIDAAVSGELWPVLLRIAQDRTIQESVGVGLGALVLVMLLGRLLGRGGPTDEVADLQEQLRQAELRIAAARADVDAARETRVRLAERDPGALANTLAMAVSETRGRGKKHAPETWLDPLRSVLADAYLGMARATLAGAESEADLKEARRLAWGAAAAAPERAECEEVLSRLDEAEQMMIFSEMSEAEALAWKIVRLESLDSAKGGQRGLVERRRGRIGHELYLAGWEEVEIRAAAMAELHQKQEAEETEKAAEEVQRKSVAAARFRSGRKSARKSREAEEMLDTAEEAEVLEAVAVGAHGGPSVVMMDSHRGGRKHGTAGGGGGAKAGSDRDDGNGRGGELVVQAHNMSEREAELRRLWERRRRPDMLGEAHPRTLASRANIAHEIARQGRHGEAEAMFREVLEAMREHESLGPTHPDTLAVWHNMAFQMAKQGNLEDAAEEFGDLLAALASPKGPGRNHPLALIAAHGLAEIWYAKGEFEDAENGFEAVWKQRSEDKEFGPDHPYTLWSRIRMLAAAEAAKAAS